MVLGSSWVMLIMHTRPFSNTLESFFLTCALVLYFIPMENYPASMANWRFFLFGAIVSLGIFTRFTFLFFFFSVSLGILFELFVSAEDSRLFFCFFSSLSFSFPGPPSSFLLVPFPSCLPSSPPDSTFLFLLPKHIASWIPFIPHFLVFALLILEYSVSHSPLLKRPFLFSSCFTFYSPPLHSFSFLSSLPFPRLLVILSLQYSYYSFSCFSFPCPFPFILSNPIIQCKANGREPLSPFLLFSLPSLFFTIQADIYRIILLILLHECGDLVLRAGNFGLEWMNTIWKSPEYLE